MGENRLITLADLLIDEHNPRLSTVDAGQRVSLHDLAQHEPSKLLTLAESIATHGISPVDIPLVMPHPTQSGRYTVLEGNRRLAALQILENPNILGTAVDQSVRKRFGTASATYQKHPVEKILCCVMDRDEARYWMLLRHTADNRGAGVSPWGTIEQSRFDGKAEPFVDILERLVTDNLISQADLKAITPTNFQRVIETLGVREYLGYSFNEGRVHYETPWPIVAKTFVRVVQDLKNKVINVNALRTAEQRVKYIRSLTPAPASSASRAKKNAAGKKKGGGKAGATTKAAPRISLIPDACQLHVTEPRIASIELELRQLALKQFPNAIAIMFRVFLEMSVERYVKANSVAIHAKSHLHQKISASITHLAKAGRLTTNEERAARSATQSNTLLATSSTSLNDYVHNPHWSPLPTELRASWDRLQPLFTALWPV